jgi:hypothetical protein
MSPTRGTGPTVEVDHRVCEAIERAISAGVCRVAARERQDDRWQAVATIESGAAADLLAAFCMNVGFDLTTADHR